MSENESKCQKQEASEMTGVKNINKAEIMNLKEQVAYQEGQVVNKTLAQSDAVSVTLFAFDKDEEW